MLQVVSLLLRSGQFSAAYLQRSDMPHTALMLAAKHGHNECIGLLVKHGFDVNRKLPGGNGGTALHEAALTGKVDTVRYLLQVTPHCCISNPPLINFDYSAVWMCRRPMHRAILLSTL